jgi:hypothetical protein
MRMRHLGLRAILAICLFFSVAVAIPFSTFALDATPTASSEAWPPPKSTCGETAPIDPRDLSFESPVDGALVRPAGAPDQDLYLLEVTLPQDTCLAFDGHRRHDGAIVWYVQEGTITIDIAPVTGLPAPDISLGRGDGGIEQFLDSAILEEGDWISVDRMADYSYRNTGDSDATVLMTVLEHRQVYDGGLNSAAQAAGGCRGLCKSSRR